MELGGKLSTGGRSHPCLCTVKTRTFNMHYLRNYSHLKSRSEDAILLRESRHFSVTKNRTMTSSRDSGRKVTVSRQKSSASTTPVLQSTKICLLNLSHISFLSKSRETSLKRLFTVISLIKDA